MKAKKLLAVLCSAAMTMSLFTGFPADLFEKPVGAVSASAEGGKKLTEGVWFTEGDTVEFTDGYYVTDDYRGILTLNNSLAGTYEIKSYYYESGWQQWCIGVPGYGTMYCTSEVSSMDDICGFKVTGKGTESDPYRFEPALVIKPADGTKVHYGETVYFGDANTGGSYFTTSQTPVYGKLKFTDWPYDDNNNPFAEFEGFVRLRYSRTEKYTLDPDYIQFNGSGTSEDPFRITSGYDDWRYVTPEEGAVVEVGNILKISSAGYYFVTDDTGAEPVVEKLEKNFMLYVLDTEDSANWRLMVNDVSGEESYLYIADANNCAVEPDGFVLTGSGTESDPFKLNSLTIGPEDGTVLHVSEAVKNNGGYFKSVNGTGYTAVALDTNSKLVNWRWDETSKTWTLNFSDGKTLVTTSEDEGESVPTGFKISGYGTQLNPYEVTPDYSGDNSYYDTLFGCVIKPGDNVSFGYGYTQYLKVDTPNNHTVGSLEDTHILEGWEYDKDDPSWVLRFRKYDSTEAEVMFRVFAEDEGEEIPTAFLITGYGTDYCPYALMPLYGETPVKTAANGVTFRMGDVIDFGGNYFYKVDVPDGPETGQLSGTYRLGVNMANRNANNCNLWEVYFRNVNENDRKYFTVYEPLILADSEKTPPAEYKITGSGTEADPFRFSPIYDEFSKIYITDTARNKNIELERTGAYTYRGIFMNVTDAGGTRPLETGSMTLRLKTILGNDSVGFDIGDGTLTIGTGRKSYKKTAYHRTSDLGNIVLDLPEGVYSLAFELDLSNYNEQTGEGAVLLIEANAIEHYLRVEPKCETDGCLEYWFDPVNFIYYTQYSETDGYSGAVAKSKLTIPAVGHDWVNWVTEQVDYGELTESRYCRRCSVTRTRSISLTEPEYYVEIPQYIEIGKTAKIVVRAEGGKALVRKSNGDTGFQEAEYNRYLKGDSVQISVIGDGEGGKFQLKDREGNKLGAELTASIAENIVKNGDTYSDAGNSEWKVDVEDEDARDILRYEDCGVEKVGDDDVQRYEGYSEVDLTFDLTDSAEYAGYYRGYVTFNISVTTNRDPLTW